MVLKVIDSNLPPLVSDPRVTEWIHREAERGHLDAEAKATEEAITLAQATYKSQLNISSCALKEDL